MSETSGMSQVEFELVLGRIQREEEEVRAAGQKEYAHTEAFGNFNRLAKMFNLDRKLVLWIYAQKHLDGIVSYLNGHKSQREDVRGRIKDARLYLALLWGMIEEEEDGEYGK